MIDLPTDPEYKLEGRALGTYVAGRNTFDDKTMYDYINGSLVDLGFDEDLSEDVCMAIMNFASDNELNLAQINELLNNLQQDGVERLGDFCNVYGRNSDEVGEFLDDYIPEIEDRTKGMTNEELIAMDEANKRAAQEVLGSAYSDDKFVCENVLCVVDGKKRDYYNLQTGNKWRPQDGWTPAVSILDELDLQIEVREKVKSMENE